MFQLNTEKPPRLVVFAGVDHRRGCGEICSSVAEMLASDQDRQVCLVDANFRSPVLSEFFGTANNFGLADALSGVGSIRSYTQPAPNRESLRLLACGAIDCDSPSLLTSGRLRERLGELRAEFDVVIVDAPPLVEYSDAIALGKLADGVVLIVEAGSTRRETAAQATAGLRSSKVPILGAVLNNLAAPLRGKRPNRL
jgi:Mrp family chromosome partitioning ATPase